MPMNNYEVLGIPLRDIIPALLKVGTMIGLLAGILAVKNI